MNVFYGDFLENSTTLAVLLDCSDFFYVGLTFFFFWTVSISTFWTLACFLELSMGDNNEPVAGPSRAPDPPAEPRQPEGFQDDGEYVNRNLNVGEILDMWNLVDIVRELGTNELCVAYSEEQGLVLKKRMCPIHRSSMRIGYSFCKSSGTFICSKGTCRYRGTKIPRRKGTFFENITLHLKHVYYLLYAYSKRWSYSETIHEDPYRREKQQCNSQ